jgi:hypothetical protein
VADSPVCEPQLASSWGQVQRSVNGRLRIRQFAGRQAWGRAFGGGAEALFPGGPPERRSDRPTERDIYAREREKRSIIFIYYLTGWEMVRGFGRPR